MKLDYEIKWWKDWLEADSLKRSDMVEKLPLVRDIGNMSQLPEEMRRHTFATMLNGFFEDLESAIYTKIEIEKEKKRNKK